MSNGTVQNPLSLVLTIKSGTSPAKLDLPLTGSAKAGAGPVTILHFAWLIHLGGNKVLLTTVYDGDFDAYLDAFIDADPQKFNIALPLLEGAPPPPITDPVNRAAFHKFVRDNNIAPLSNFFSAYPNMTVIKVLRCEQS